jgi:hypothetical protein
MSTWKRNIPFAAGNFLIALALTSCSTTSVQSVRTDSIIAKPDRIVVHEFAVSSAEIELDPGLGHRLGFEHDPTTRTEEQIEVGHAVAVALTKKLIAELNKAGIPATLAAPEVQMTARTVSLKGYFTSVDEGNKTARVVVGFGLGRSKVKAHGFVYQGSPPDEREVGRFETVAKSGIKPGIGPVAGVGANVAVAAGTAIVSEKYLTSVEKSAADSAKKIAKRIKKYYNERGWL